MPEDVVDPETLRITMRKWSTGVTVVTTATGAERSGMTVSSFTSVSLNPAVVLVCLDQKTYTFSLIKRGGVFAVSILATGQDWLSMRFAGQDPNASDRFADLALTTAKTGAPILPGVLAWLDCRVRALHDAGSHVIVLGDVVDAGNDPDGAPLVYHNRGYYTLTEPQNA